MSKANSVRKARKRLVREVLSHKQKLAERVRRPAPFLPNINGHRYQNGRLVRR